VVVGAILIDNEGVKPHQDTQETQLLQRNSMSATHVFLGWLNDCIVY